MFAFALNLPWTVLGLLLGSISFPTKIVFKKNPYHFVIDANNFWWARGWMKGARAAALGHVILMSPLADQKDYIHELVHIQQYVRLPLIHPFVYYFYLARFGYRKNPFEEEAYSIAENSYEGK